VKSNCQPITTTPAKPCPEVPSLPAVLTSNAGSPFYENHRSGQRADGHQGFVTDGGETSLCFPSGSQVALSRSLGWTVPGDKKIWQLGRTWQRVTQHWGGQSLGEPSPSRSPHPETAVVRRREGVVLLPAGPRRRPNPRQTPVSPVATASLRRSPHHAGTST